MLGGTGRVPWALGSGDMSVAMDGSEGRSTLSLLPDMAVGCAGSKGSVDLGEIVLEAGTAPPSVSTGSRPGFGLARLARGSPVSGEASGCDGAAAAAFCASGGGVAARGGGEGIRGW